MIDREFFDKKYPDITDNLKCVYDPEIPIDIYELGLIYDINVAVEKAGYDPVKINLTFDPPWEKDFVSNDGRLMLGF